MLEVVLSALVALLLLAFVYVVLKKVLQAFGGWEDPIVTIVNLLFLVLAILIALRTFGLIGSGHFVIWAR